MHAYIINLDAAVERWKYVSANFAATQIPFTRIPGVEGKKLALPIPEYAEALYRRCHGQRTSLGQVGCYLSHLESLRAFLDSPHEVAIIAEDDARPVANLRVILDQALRYQGSWDILRLCGFHNPHAIAYAALNDGYRLSVCFTRLCGTGAYMVTRDAAKVLLEKLVPMRLPIDHALDREWTYGLRAAAIIPLPVSQTENAFAGQCGSGLASLKLPWYRRYWTVFPWRAWNETCRVLRRMGQLRRARRVAHAMQRPAATS